jgi:hypothetical protein
MKWCCIPFKNYYATAGERGISILIGRNSAGKPEFVMQHRAVDKEIESLPYTDYPISIITDACIVYCPWCGRKLDKWYGKYVDELYKPGLIISNL